MSKTLKRKDYWKIFLLFVFLMHGCWDSLISLVSHFADESKNPNADMIGGILFGIVILIGIIYIVISTINIRKVLKNNKKMNNCS